MTNDSLKTTALAHEFQRCRDSFELFAYLSSLLLSGIRDKQLSIRCYNAYVDFVAQLYEFYLGIVGTKNGFKNKSKHHPMDQIINTETSKLLKIRRDRIQREDAPSWENHISYYEVEVPEEFAYNFRKVRNLRSHAGPLRASFNLAEFYKKYHKFVYILYEEPQWLWHVENVTAYDWKEVEMFSKVLFEKDA